MKCKLCKLKEKCKDYIFIISFYRKMSFSFNINFLLLNMKCKRYKKEKNKNIVINKDNRELEEIERQILW